MPQRLTRNTLDPSRLPPVLTAAQYRDLTGKSLMTIYRWINAGILKTSRPEGTKSWNIPRSELARVNGWEGIPDP